MWLFVFVFNLVAALQQDFEKVKVLTDSQCKLVPVFSDFLDVVLQVVEEQFHHVQLLLSPPDRTKQQHQYKVIPFSFQLFCFPF